MTSAYAERHPHQESKIVISGVTTTRRSEIDWLGERGVAVIGGDVVVAEVDK
jgi:hypothetical protein